MSSNLCCRLRQIFQRKPTGTTSPTISGNDHLEYLVDRFKKKSNSTNFRRNRLAYKITVNRLARVHRFSSIHDILNHQKQYPDITDEHFAARLISLYGESRMFDHALQLFDEMPDLNCPRSVLSFNALLAACIASKEFDKFSELFREIPRKLSIEPDIISYNTMIKAFCEVGSMDAAVSLLDEIEKNGIEPNLITFHILLGSFYKGDAENFSKAETFWSLMQEKEVVLDVRSYNSRLHGMMRQKRVSEALDVLKEMEERGLQPNHYSYNVMIKGFVDEGNLKEAKKWYASMIGNGYMADFFTHATLIPFACSKNDVDFAHELCIKSVDMKRPVSNGLMQKVADALFEQSEAEKAKELLKLKDSKGRLPDGNSLPAGD
ncbi:small ribosomal subunit protein mL103 (rPPR7)-like [Primulina tabacum]|uniref:small ribosomal subunit protein mL103 (rPPR7)-like n=1 Tax=Primulina tabacum TaxID=48773 RepID=UPI003F5A4CD7